jgi:histidinol-phosphate/aromatic aminotransferase/cobyric acid decarboxylase-like protein
MMAANSLLCRSSMLYALAGLRIAYGLCGSGAQKLLGYQPYYLGFSRILEETALAALAATGYYKKLRERIIADRNNFIIAVNKLNHFTAYPSDATFVLIKPDTTIRELFKRTVEKTPFTLVRPISETHFRVSLDPQKYTKIFIKILEQIDRLSS